MPNFAFIKDQKVQFIESVNPTGPALEKWIALFRSGVLLKETTRYNVMPGDLFIDGRFYKKDSTNAPLEEGEWTHPTSVRFAGIMDGEVVGQYGKDRSLLGNEEDVSEFIDVITSSQIVELTTEQSSYVEKGWIYDGFNFVNPDRLP